MTEQRYDEFRRIMKEYNLYKDDCINLKRITDFLNENKNVVKLLKEYVDFDKSCPFNIDEPVIDDKGKCHLIVSITLKPVNGVLQYTDLNVIDAKGKTKTIKINEVKRFNKQMQEIVE